MNKIILHVDFNSYFATVEQQANPHLRGKPVGVTGGDRIKRTVLGAASVEAKRFGVKTGMQIWQARKLCPQIILVPGDSDKYLECTKRFINILKDFSPYVEVFSIDECFLEVTENCSLVPTACSLAMNIKSRIRSEIGEWITCSVGISYNKLMAKLAGSLQKPDGLVIIENPEQAMKVLDHIPLDEICGIGSKIQHRLERLGIFNFKQLRQVPLQTLLFEFKSYGKFLYDASRGINDTPITPFYEKEEVKSVGHRHTIDHDTDDPEEIKQILLKLCEMVAKRLRDKKLAGKTVNLWYREAFQLEGVFFGDGMQTTIPDTNDGLEIFKAGWRVFHQIWTKEKIRMIGVSIANLRPENPHTISLLEDKGKLINTILDQVNQKHGEFTLQRGILLGSVCMRRKPNPYLSDRRFTLQAQNRW